MTTFNYQARNEQGQLLSGVIKAASIDDAGEMLSQRNLFVLDVQQEATTLTPSSRYGKANRAQVAWQMSQLSIMVETGIPLSEALDCLSRQATKPKVQVLLEDVSRNVQEGAALSTAMAMHPNSYSPSLVALIRASEVSGTMGTVLHRASTYLINELQALKRLRGALMYPAFMFITCVTVTIFLLGVILPRFEAVFASRGAILPLPTRVLMAMSANFTQYWYIWLLVTAMLGLGLWLWPRTRIGKTQIDRMLIRLPVLRSIFNPLYQSRTFRTFSVLLDTGVPLVEALAIVRDVTPNVFYQRLWMEVDEHIRHGEPLAGPLLQSDLIPESIAQMIDNGDRSGKLGLVFTRLADFVEEEYNQALRTATQMIEPLMILMMGSVIGFIAASLMLPLFQAGRVMSS
jgi:type IV pilus assembly protein PilC